jgi:hypothetical protein
VCHDQLIYIHKYFDCQCMENRLTGFDFQNKVKYIRFEMYRLNSMCILLNRFFMLDLQYCVILIYCSAHFDCARAIASFICFSARALASEI